MYLIRSNDLDSLYFVSKNYLIMMKWILVSVAHLERSDNLFTLSVHVNLYSCILLNVWF